MKYRYAKSPKDLRKIAETIPNNRERDALITYIHKLEAANVNIGHRCLSNLRATMPVGTRLLRANSLEKLQRALDATINTTSKEAVDILRFY